MVLRGFFRCMRPGVFWVVRLSPDLDVVALCSNNRAPPGPVRTVKCGQSIPMLFSKLLQGHLYILYIIFRSKGGYNVIILCLHVAHVSLVIRLYGLFFLSFTLTPIELCQDMPNWVCARKNRCPGLLNSCICTFQKT